TIFGTTEFCRSRLTNTPYSPRYLGGNGILASLAAGKHTPVDLISVIGTDMSRAKVKSILGENITIENVLQMEGKSFDYGATYDAKSFELVGEEIEFGVYGSYQPRVFTKEAKEAKCLLFSGSNPRFGLEVLRQISNPEVIGVNTLLYHLKHNAEYSIKLIDAATHLFTSLKEYEYMTKEMNYTFFSPERPLQYIFKTKGIEGVEVITPHNKEQFPVPRVVKPLDPINAGDVFAGTIMGMVAKGCDCEKNLKE
ncbi:MAG: hypothetical protein AAB634_02050, partial [Patescibacteria group bacterium]